MLTRDFIMGGNATFTVEVSATSAAKLGCQPHYTFKVSKPTPTTPYFVSLLTGPDNTADYTYLGVLGTKRGEVLTTKKSRHGKDSLPIRILDRVLARIWAGEGNLITEAGWDVHHVGKCCRCGRQLTTPESVRNGIGPECAKAVGRAG